MSAHQVLGKHIFTKTFLVLSVIFLIGCVFMFQRFTQGLGAVSNLNGGFARLVSGARPNRNLVISIRLQEKTRRLTHRCPDGQAHLSQTWQSFFVLALARPAPETDASEINHLVA